MSRTKRARRGGGQEARDSMKDSDADAEDDVEDDIEDDSYDHVPRRSGASQNQDHDESMDVHLREFGASTGEQDNRGAKKEVSAQAFTDLRRPYNTSQDSPELYSPGTQHMVPPTYSSGTTRRTYPNIAAKSEPKDITTYYPSPAIQNSTTPEFSNVSHNVGLDPSLVSGDSETAVSPFP